MKTLQSITVVCSITEKPIVGPGLVMVGSLHRLNSDGTVGEEVLKAGEGGDAYALGAFLSKVRGSGESATRTRKTVVHATVDEVVKAIKAAGGTVIVSKLAKDLEREAHALRKGLEEAEKSGLIVKMGRGVYQIAPKSQKGSDAKSASAAA